MLMSSFSRHSKIISVLILATEAKLLNCSVSSLTSPATNRWLQFLVFRMATAALTTVLLIMVSPELSDVLEVNMRIHLCSH